MNEKIEQLAKQAGLITEFWHDLTPLEKFAELIVRECADMFNETDAVTGSFVKKVLKEHFGVEE